MRKTSRCARFVALVASLGALGAPASVATTVATPDPNPPRPGARLVHVGGGDLRDDVATDLEVQFMAFYPETIRVHRGDTIEWRFPGGFGSLHTVTFLPGDMDVRRAPRPREDAHRPIVREDELPGTLAFSEELMLGTGCGLVVGDDTNGRAPQPPCVIDSVETRYGSQLSDALFNINDRHPTGFAATIDLPPGRYRYHCNVHPSMHGYVEVVPDDAPLEPQSAIDRAARRALRRDLDTAVALHRDRSRQAPVVDGDRRVWTVSSGARSADGRVSINDYMPAELTVAPGDVVRFAAVGVEPHTVTFPAEPVGSFTDGGCDMTSCDGDIVPVGLVLAAAPWACEYDEPAAGSPALTTWAPRVGCAGGGDVEWTVGPLVAAPTPAPGNAVTPPATFHNSGFMFPPPGAVPNWYRARSPGTSWPAVFDATFPEPGTFSFACQIHTGRVATEAVTGPARSLMVGTIRVAG